MPGIDGYVPCEARCSTCRTIMACSGSIGRCGQCDSIFQERPCLDAIAPGITHNIATTANIERRAAPKPSYRLIHQYQWIAYGCNRNGIRMTSREADAGGIREILEYRGEDMAANLGSIERGLRLTVYHGKGHKISGPFEESFAEIKDGKLPKCFPDYQVDGQPKRIPKMFHRELAEALKTITPYQPPAVPAMANPRPQRPPSTWIEPVLGAAPISPQAREDFENAIMRAAARSAARQVEQITVDTITGQTIQATGWRTDVIANLNCVVDATTQYVWHRDGVSDVVLAYESEPENDRPPEF